MSSDTHLCNRCGAIFDTGPDLPRELGPEEEITVAWYGPSGTQWISKDTGKYWTQVGGMFHERLWEDESVDKAALVQSAAEGCYICVSILGTFTGRFSQFTNEAIGNSSSLEKIEYELGSTSDDSFSLVIRVYCLGLSIPNRPHGLQSLEIPFYGVLRSKVPSEPVQTSLASTTRSLQSLQQARAWIDYCEQNHATCQRSKGKFDLPRRLIRVGMVEDTGELSASLCESSTLPSDTQYLSLSHRWGKQEHLKLTKDNLSQLECDIPMDQLSSLFRDAFFMTHHLGLSYVWIDSLCIIQDDTEDWERECQAMCRTYKGALCNIAASSNLTDEGQGFLPLQRQRHPIVPPLVHINWHASPVSPNDICGRDYIISESMPFRDVPEDELFNRAWLLQEQLLPLRILHCYGDQLYWECRTSTCNEVWPRGWIESLQSHTTFENPNERFRIHPEDLDAEEETLPYIVWLEMVSWYSRRAITYRTDRLLALAGIAADTEALINDDCVYGIWRKYLHNGVLYQSPSIPFSLKEPPVPRPLWDKVPSWSWASTSLPVDFATKNHPPITIELCPIDLLPGAQPSVLEIKGPLIPMEWVKTSDDAVKCNAFWKPASNDPMFERPAKNGAIWDIGIWEDHWFARECAASGQPYIEAVFDQVFFMPILYQMAKRGQVRLIDLSSRDSYYYGLLLRAAIGKERGTYRRVGIARFTDMGVAEDIFANFRVMISTQVRGIRREDVRQKGETAYTIWVA